MVDFGFARLMPAPEESPMRTPCFSLQYAAPEVLALAMANGGNPESDVGGYNHSCDLWSLGTILVRLK